MKKRFKKDYYQDTVINKDGEVEIVPGFKTMWHFSMEEDYFTEDKQEALRQAIIDLENELNKLKEIEKKNDKALDTWDSISK